MKRDTALPRLLVTGAAGLVGRTVLPSLRARYDIITLDRSPLEGQHVTCDLAADGWGEHSLLARGVDAIVHLAGDPSAQAEWSSVLRNNIAATAEVYRYAEQNRIARVVLASSNQVCLGYETPFPPTRPITVADPVRPVSYYGVSKVSAEAIARAAFERSGVSSICLRIASVRDHDDPTRESRMRATWLSHRDLQSLVIASLESKIGFGIYFGVSANSRRFWDIRNAEEDLRWSPLDDAEVHWARCREPGVS